VRRVSTVLLSSLLTGLCRKYRRVIPRLRSDGVYLQMHTCQSFPNTHTLARAQFSSGRLALWSHAPRPHAHRHTRMHTHRDAHTHTHTDTHTHTHTHTHTGAHRHTDTQTHTHR